MKLTIDEYIKKFKDFRDDAYEKKNKKTGDFINHLLSKGVGVDIYDVFYNYYDNLNDEDIDVYEYLLSKNAAYDWYSASSYISDQRAGLSDYAGIIKRMFDNGLAANDLVECEARTSNKEEFIECAENLILKFGSNSDEGMLSEKDNHVRIENEFIKHLKSENSRLESRYEDISKELSGLRKEYKDVLQHLDIYKQKSEKYKNDFEEINSVHGQIKREKDIFECKYLNQKKIVEQLSSINTEQDELIRNLTTERDGILDKYVNLKKEQENTSNTKEIDALKRENGALKNDINSIRAENNELNRRIEVLNRQINEYEKTSGLSESQSIDNIGDTSFNNEYDDFSSYLGEESFDEMAVLPMLAGEREKEYIDDNMIEYNSDDLIVLDDKTNKVDKIKEKVKAFIASFTKLFNHKFENLSLEDKKAIISSSLMENDYSMDVTRGVMQAIKNNSDISLAVIYKLIQKKSSEEDILSYCNGN